MPIDPNRERVSIRYRADDGNFYAVVTSRNHAAAVNANGSLAADPPLPTKWRPRHYNLLQVLNGRDRTMQVIEPQDANVNWLQQGGNLTVQPYGLLRITGRTGEKRTQGAPPFDGNANPPNERVTIRYRSENGNDYNMITTRAHAAAVQAAGGGNFPLFPEIWTPRHYVLISPQLNGRDQKATLVEPNPAAAAYVSNQAFQFNIGGNLFNSTGRVEEHRPEGAPSYVP